MADDEQALVARIAADDQEALRVLYTRYRPRLWRYLCRRLDGDAEAVEDALQETWLAVWRGAPDYQPRGQVAAWIFQIAHRHVAHLRRDNARTLEGRIHPRALDTEPAPGNATPSGSPGATNVQPGPPLPEGVTMTNVTLAAPGEYWATGFIKDKTTGNENTGVILRFSKGKWEQVGDLLHSGHVDGIEMVSATEGWAWGGDTNDSGLLLYIGNGAWQRVAARAVNRKGSLQFVRVSSAPDAWLVI